MALSYSEAKTQQDWYSSRRKADRIDTKEELESQSHQGKETETTFEPKGSEAEESLKGASAFLVSSKLWFFVW